MGAIKKVLDYLEKFLMFFCVALLLIMVVSTSLQVISRYLFPVPISWTEELSRRVMSWLLFLAAPIAYRKGAQIGVDYLVNKLPQRLKTISEIIVDLSVVFFSITMITQGLTLAEKSFRQISSALDISMKYVYMVIPFSGLLICIFAAERIIASVHRLLTQKETLS